MVSVQYIHWHKEEAMAGAQRIQTFGHTVFHDQPAGQNFFRELATRGLEAVIIDLTRLPAQGRDAAIYLRKQKSTRHLPIIFLEGDSQKKEKIRQLLPDTVFATWADIEEKIGQALASETVVYPAPSSVFAAYAHRPLVKKLGIKNNMSVTLLQAPPDFIQTVGALPEGATFKHDPATYSDLVIWFVRNRQDLIADHVAVFGKITSGSLWIAWPKKAASPHSDLTQQFVRDTGLNNGLVDFKICSIDKIWSALLFTRRKS